MNKPTYAFALSLALIGAATAPTACSPERKDAQVQQHLTNEQIRVFGFEAPFTDWSTNNGSPIAQSATTSQGIASLSVIPNGYSEISSVPIQVSGTVNSSISLDLSIPQALSWGELRLVAIIPSQGKYWSDLGGHSLAGVEPGSFAQYSFAVSQDVQGSIASGTDVSFKIILNSPQGSGEFLLDNLVVSSDGGTPGDDPPEADGFLHVNVPSSHGAGSAVITALETLYIAERVELGNAGSRLAMVSGGTAYIGDHSKIGNLVAAGEIDLRNYSKVDGNVTSGGTITQHFGVAIDGEAISNVTLTFRELLIRNPAFSATGGNVSLEPTQNLVLPPGNYGALSVKSGARIQLAAGIYTFTSIQIEPQAIVEVDADCGVEVFSRDSAFFRGEVEPGDGASPGLLLTHLGTSDVHIEASFAGRVIAPKASVYLNSTTHLHKVIARTVRLQPDAHFVRSGSAAEPVLLATLSPAPDTCNGATCCPSEEDQEERAQPHSCLAATEQSEVVSPQVPEEGIASMVFAGGGADEIRNPHAGSLIAMGDGDDKVCALSQFSGLIDGGSGNDLILLSEANDTLIIPGSGVDQVRILGGSARIAIMAACEAQAGESYVLESGTATLLSPLSREELENRGVHVDPDITVEFSPGNLCLSECSGAPTCAEDEICVSDGTVAYCEAKDESLTAYSPAVHPGYPDLPDGLREAVEEYVARIAAGSHFASAPQNLRLATQLIVPALVEATASSTPRRRAAETFAIGSLFTTEALAALVDVALQPAPDTSKTHYGGKGWHIASIHAVRWLAVAAIKEPQQAHHLQNLMILAVQGDRLTSQSAVSAYLQVGDESERRAELEASLPADREYLLTLEYR